MKARILVLVVLMAVLVGMSPVVQQLFIPDTQQAPVPIWIIDGEGKDTVMTMMSHAKSDERRMYDRFSFSYSTAQLADEVSAEVDQTIAVSDIELENHANLTKKVKEWIESGARVYIYGDRLRLQQLENQLDISLQCINPAKRKVDEVYVDRNYHIVGIQQNREGEERALFFVANIDITKFQPTLLLNRTNSSPMTEPESTLRSILLYETRLMDGTLPRTELSSDSKAEGHRWIEAVDMMNTSFLKQDNGHLLLLADLTVHYDLYRVLNETVPEYDFFYLKDTVQLNVHNNAQSKSLMIAHRLLFPEDKILDRGPDGEGNGKAVDVRLAQDAKWSFANDTSSSYQEDGKLTAGFAKWTVAPRWWQDDLDQQFQFVPGISWKSKLTYTGVDLTHQATIRHGVREYQLSRNVPVRYEY